MIDTAERIFAAFDIIDELTKERRLVTRETVLAYEQTQEPYQWAAEEREDVTHLSFSRLVEYRALVGWFILAGSNYLDANEIPDVGGSVWLCLDAWQG